MSDAIVPAMENRSTAHASRELAVTRIISDAGFDSLKPTWDELLVQSDINTIFQTHNWLRSWWAAFGKGNELCILVIKSGDAIVGIAPLMVKNGGRRGFRSRTVQFIGAPDADYGDIIGDNKPLLWKHVIDYLRANDRNWDKLSFEQINQDSTSLQALRELLPVTDEVYQIVESDRCLKFTYRDEESKRAEFAIRRSHDLKRCFNFFKNSNGFELKRISDPNEIEKELQMLFHLHATRWEETITPSKFTEEQFRRFYYELVNRLQPNGQLCLMASYSGDIPITLSLNYEYNRMIYHYTLAFNSYFSKKSPGTLHVLIQTEEFVRTGFELDFARGAGPYKKLVADEEYGNYRVTIFGRTWEKQVRDLYDWLKRTSFGQKLVQSRSAQERKGRLLILLHEHGLFGTIGHWLGDLFGKLIRVRSAQYYALSGSAQTRGNSAAIRELNANTLPQLATFYGYVLDSPEAKQLAGRFEKKERCFGLFMHQVLSAVVWQTSEKQISVLEGKSIAHSGESALTDLAISPAFDSVAPVAQLITVASREASPVGNTLLARSIVTAELESALRDAGLTVSKQSARSLALLGQRVF